MSKNGFTIVSNMILNDDGLNIYEKYFLISLKSFDYKNRGEVYPTYEALMKLFGTTNRNTISNVVKSLKDKNYIITMKKNRANCYKFIKDYLAGNFKNNNTDSCKNDSDTESNVGSSNEENIDRDIEDINYGNIESSNESDNQGNWGSYSEVNGQIISNKNDADGINLDTTSNSSNISCNGRNTSNSNGSNATYTNVNASSMESDTISSNSSHTSNSNRCDTVDADANISSNGSDTISSSSNTSNSMGSDTNEANVNTSSNGSDTSSSNLSHTATSMESDTTEANTNISSMGSDTSTSNSTHTTSSMECDTQIKQYKYKKEIYTKIFNRWNDKNISNEEVLTVSIANCMESALKIFTVDQVLQTIDNYAEVYKSEFYYSYLWDLKNFLINPKGIRKFATEGHLWRNYLNESKKAKKIKASEYID